MHRLRVARARRLDVYSSMVRVKEHHRGGIPSGTICKVTIRKGLHSKTRVMLVRGLEDREPDCIRMDDFTRERFGVLPGDDVDLSISRAPISGFIRYMMDAADPAVRTACTLGLFAFALSLIQLGLAIHWPNADLSRMAAALSNAANVLGKP